MAQFNEFFANNLMLFIALFIILVLILRTYIGPGQVKNLAPVEAIQMLNKENGIILDVRTDHEFSEGHILNSLHIPLGLLESSIAKLENHKDDPIIICCRVGSRSRQAAVLLKKQGFDKIFQIKGGIMAWQNANMPLTTESKPVKNKSKKKTKKQIAQNNAIEEDNNTTKEVELKSKSDNDKSQLEQLEKDSDSIKS